MNDKRSYIETLNAGRTRRDRASLSSLKDKLDALEGRLDRHPPASKRPAWPQPTNEHDVMPAMARRSVAAPHLQPDHEERFAYGDRSPRAGVASPQSQAERSEMEDEIAKISETIGLLSERVGASPFANMHEEIQKLTRTVQDLAQRAEADEGRDAHQRFRSLEDHITSGMASQERNSEAVQSLTQRLAHALEEMDGLAISKPIQRLEQRIETLAEQLRHAPEPNSAQSGALRAEIEDRLDELTRAIAANSHRTVTIDPAPMERLEARLASLSRQIETGPQSAVSEQFAQRLEQLGGRVEDLASRSGLADSTIERLAGQLATLTDHFERQAMPDLSPVLGQIEERLTQFGEDAAENQRQVVSHSRRLFADLDQRLDALADRFASMPSMNEATEAALSEIEGRLSRLGERLEAQDGRDAENRAGLLRAVDERFSSLSDKLDQSLSQTEERSARGFDTLEERVSRLSDRIEEQPGNTIDADKLQRFEEQIGALSGFMERADKNERTIAELTPRLAGIEESLLKAQNEAVEHARRTAAETIERLGQRSAAGPEIAALSDDLHMLEDLSRRSESRNAETFEAIHETMLKIVDRLAQLEDIGLGAPSPARDRTSEPKTPAAPKAVTPVTPVAKTDVPDDEPAHLHSDRAEIEEDAFPTEPTDEPTETHVPAVAAMPVAETRPAIDLPDEPMEPGSGAPNLQAILRKVRGETGDGAIDGEGFGSGRKDAAEADFIAAARRAAQAAAEEAHGGRSSDRDAGKGRLNGKLKSYRVPGLTAALTLAVLFAGWQLSSVYLGEDRTNVAVSSQPDDELAAATSTPLAEKVLETDVEDQGLGSVVPASDRSEPIADDEGEVEIAALAEPSDETETEIASTNIPDSLETGSTEAVSASEPPLPLPDAIGPSALRDAVAAGDPAAYSEVGARLAEGRDIEADPEAAIEWFQLAADKGFAPAQYRLGSALEKGIGTERDIDAAEAWYRKAANQGNASAMHNLGVLIAMGALGEPNNEEAHKLFVRAAELGIKDSQFNLGILSAKGVGAEQDLVESYKWFAIAAANGDVDASQKRDEVAKALRPEQLEEARGRADLWKAKPLDPQANDAQIKPEWRDVSTTASVDMSKAVRNIQAILNNNGFDAGPPDGVMGERTKQAIEAFQSANGMDATGEIDEPLIEALLAANKQES